jgi:hypothetical protein
VLAAIGKLSISDKISPRDVPHYKRQRDRNDDEKERAMLLEIEDRA